MNSLSKHKIPAALTTMMEVHERKCIEKLTTAWYAQVAVPKDILVHKTDGSTFWVLETNRLAFLGYPVSLETVKGEPC